MSGQQMGWRYGFRAGVIAAVWWLLVPAAQGQSILVGSTADELADQRIKTALETRLSVQWDESPLDDVVSDLKQRLGIPILLDEKALDELGVGSDSPVTIAVSGLSARAVLDHMLRKIDPQLTWTIDGQSLMITTKEAAQMRLTTRIYPVRDLVGEGSLDEQEWDLLIEVIKNIVEPATWKDNGGEGEARSFPVTGALVCTQTRDVHWRIDDLLVALRASRRPAEAMAELREKVRQEEAAEEAGAASNAPRDEPASADLLANRADRGPTIDPHPPAWRIPRVYDN